jgi:hypothetical protein
MSEPIAYCVDLDEDALIEASKIIGLEPTDVKFLQMPLYTHPATEQSSLSELTDEEIYELADKCRKLANPNVEFARAIIKASRGEK